VPLLLREIRRAKWYKNAGVKWLGDDELQADALGDIRTSDNSLSVWEIADDRTNLDAIIAAIAAGRDTAANFDFALFTATAVLETNIKIIEEPGKTFDEGVNGFHRELTELTTAKLLALAEIIQRQATRERLIEPKVVAMIATAIEDGRIKPDFLSPHIRGKLRK